MQNPGPPPYYPPVAPPPAKSGVPIWVWIVGGFAGCFVLCIAVMAAILFPVFAQAREKARQTSCLSNLKQLGLAANMYLQDYDMVYPLKDNWADGIYPYLKNEAIFVCPSQGREAGSAFSYAYNSNLSGFKMDKMVDPNTTYMLFDSNKNVRNASDPLESLPSPPRHLQTNNICYTNGMVKNIPTEMLSSYGSADPKAGSGLVLP